MKQVLLGRRIHVTEVPEPGLGRGQVLVEVAYSFISTGTEVAGIKSAAGGVISKIKEHPQRVAQVLDLVRVNGVRKTLAMVRSKLESRNPIGYSCSGRVIAVGEAVRDLAIGDRVACAGMGYAAHAEVVAVPRNLVARLPEGCDWRQASGTTVASIALQGVRRADLRLGETAAVMGLGLLGQITLQLLTSSGVQVLGFDPNPQRVQEAQADGFCHCFAMSGEEAAHEVLARTGDMGADATVITAATNAPGICQDAMQMTRRKGRVVVVGAVPLEFDRDPAYRKEIDFFISCSYGPGRYDPAYEENGQDYPYAYVRWTENRNMQAILGMIAAGTLRLDSLISGEYPIANAEQAFASLTAEGGPRPLGIVIKYDLAELPEPRKRMKSVTMPVPVARGDKIGLGVVGLGGFFSGTHLPNLLTLTDRFQIVSVCDRASAKAQDIARQTGAAQACSEVTELIANDAVQAVIITTRHDTHAPLAMQALRAGKHVFVEKPMAMNAAQLDELLEAIQASGKVFMVGFNRRFSPHAARLRELSATRQGPLMVNYRVLADPAPSDSWIYTSAGGGRVIGEACHMLDLFNFLAGDDRAEAELDVIAPPPGVGGPPGDNFMASIRYEDGSLCALTYSVAGRKSAELGKERIEALWDGKSFVIDDFARSFGVGCSAGRAASVKSKGHREELSALADFLQGRGPVPISVDACVKATEMSFRVDAVCRGLVSDEPRQGSLSPGPARARVE